VKRKEEKVQREEKQKEEKEKEEKKRKRRKRAAQRSRPHSQRTPWRGSARGPVALGIIVKTPAHASQAPRGRQTR